MHQRQATVQQLDSWFHTKLDSNSNRVVTSGNKVYCISCYLRFETHWVWVTQKESLDTKREQKTPFTQISFELFFYKNKDKKDHKWELTQRSRSYQQRKRGNFVKWLCGECAQTTALLHRSSAQHRIGLHGFAHWYYRKCNGSCITIYLN